MPTFKSDRIFGSINGIFFIFLNLIMIAPFVHVIALSLSSSEFTAIQQIYFWPKGFNFEVYSEIFAQENLWRAMGVSVYITVMGTAIMLFLTTSMGYSLSRSQMPARKLILKLILVTFIFASPLIPFYMVVRGIGLENTLWSLIIPTAVNAFYVIIMKSFFQGLSAELFDAAYMDGASEYGIYWRIALPLALPAIATLGLFHAVAQWNQYFHALIFIRDKELYPIQILLRNLIAQGQFAQEFEDWDVLTLPPEQMKAGVIMFATLPILLVYPFIQRFFVKGAMVGSLKE